MRMTIRENGKHSCLKPGNGKRITGKTMIAAVLAALLVVQPVSAAFAGEGEVSAPVEQTDAGADEPFALTSAEQTDVGADELLALAVGEQTDAGAKEQSAAGEQMDAGAEGLSFAGEQTDADAEELSAVGEQTDAGVEEQPEKDSISEQPDKLSSSDSVSASVQASTDTGSGSNATGNTGSVGSQDTGTADGAGTKQTGADQTGDDKKDSVGTGETPVDFKTISKPKLKTGRNKHKIKLRYSTPKHATSFVIYRGTSSGKLKKIATTRKSTYTDTIAASGTGKTYYYAVVAQGRNNKKTLVKSKKSNVAMRKVPLDQPTGIRKKALVSRKTRLYWKKVPNAYAYEIFRATKKDGKYKKVGVTRKRTWKTKQLKQLQVYYYKIRAVDKKGAYKGLSCKPIRCVIRPAIPKPKVTETTPSVIRMSWSRNKKASSYQIYRASSKNGKYKKIATTKKTSWSDTGRKGKTTYYYRVYAVGQSSDHKNKTVRSGYHTISATTKKKVERTAYIGDSLMSGISEYGLVKNSSSRRVITKIGISPRGFYRNSYYMNTLLNYNPDRVYIMLGMNILGGNPSDKGLANILEPTKGIIQRVLAQNPEAQVILLPVSPVRPGAEVSQGVINRYNVMQKELADELGIYYYDYTPVMKDSYGYLSTSYKEGDGIHWKISGYRVFLSELESFEEEIN